MDRGWLDRLRSIEYRAVVILVAMVPVVQTVFDDLAVTFGFAIGGCHELLCYHLLRFAIGKIIDGTRRDKALLIAAVVAAKLLALGLGIYLVSKLLPISWVALVSGVLTFAVSAVIEIVRPDDK